MGEWGKNRQSGQTKGHFRIRSTVTAMQRITSQPPRGNAILSATAPVWHTKTNRKTNVRASHPANDCPRRGQTGRRKTNILKQYLRCDTSAAVVLCSGGNRRYERNAKQTTQSEEKHRGSRSPDVKQRTLHSETNGRKNRQRERANRKQQ